ncbi:hypothetical protein [Amycolatopsis sp. RTGN1]|uniref:hypothetical protein n=1 Tax=Amycolatopsis ponsaeliensis TaxID=2992142 RepID=UPI002549E63E|nr:hypothetical protein [Amycolatopsis sp. RTGN1]
MGMVEWMTAALLVRPVVAEIGKLVVLGRSAWSTVRPGRGDRAAGSDLRFETSAESTGPYRGESDAVDTDAER